MRKHRWLILSAVWLVVVVTGFAFLTIHSLTPGNVSGSTPERWPADSALPRDGAVPKLVMFAHPKCPCTRASITELAALMTSCQGRVSAEVVFIRPEGTEENWTLTDLWRSAAAIPGVSVRVDRGGVEAEDFRTATSGHVVLYDARGKLLFTGGITGARGHEGGNAGESAIVNYLLRGDISLSATPVFGCPLQQVKTADSSKGGS